MTPIINPWFFYFAEIFDKIGFAFVVLGLIALVIYTIMTGTAWEYGVDTDDEKRKFKSLLKGLTFSIIIFIVGLLTPSSNTMYKMAAASMLTPNNINIAKEQGKEFTKFVSEEIITIIEATKK